MQSTILTEEKEQMIANNLNLYLFQNVWNETYRALRNNIKPHLYSQRSQTGSIIVYGESLELPTTTDPYHIFVVSRDTVPGLMWPKQIESTWISSDELITKHNVLFDAYHIHGKMLHKKHVHLYKLHNGVGYLVAVNKNMFNKLLTVDDITGIRFTVYYDHDITNDITVQSFDIPASDSSYMVRSPIFKEYENLLAESSQAVDRKPAVLMFINGVETVPVGIGSIPLNSHVDLHIDRNVGIDIEIDLTDVELNAQFFSEIDECYKQIIHIPRTENPNNYMLTHNAIEIYVRKKNKEADGTIKGLYLHRCAERSVTQITHQDIAIPTYILEAYRDYFGTSEITLRLYWRQHEGVNTLVRDSNYIDLLYQNQHHDRVIIGYLAGTYKYAKELYFWTAQHLEKSEFTRMLFDVPDVVKKENITTYIDALGFYNVMFLLSSHVYTTTITDTYEGNYMFPKPLVYQGFPMAAIMYLNGEKIGNDNVIVNNISDTHVVVGLTENVNPPLGAKLSVELHRDGIQEIYKITPQLGNTILTFPATEYDILEEFTDEYPVEKFDYSTTTGLSEFTQFAGNISRTTLSDGRYQYTFGPHTYGRTFYIQPKPRVYYWSSANPHDGMNIQEKIQNGDPLLFKLEKYVTFEVINNEVVYCSHGEKCAIWDTDNVIVYVNGRYLIRDIDFTIIDVPDRKTNLGMKILNIQNYSYLKQDDENTLEVYCTSATDESREFGYCAPRKASLPEGNTPDDSIPETMAGVIQNNRTVVYDDRASIVHVNGYFTQIDISGNFITPAGTWSYHPWNVANPIEVRTTVPYFVSEYLNKYHENDDLEKIELLNKYYYNQDLRKVPVEVVTQSHLVYSIHLATILRNILTKQDTEISYDPDIERMWQQLGDYEYLKAADMIYQKDMLDRMYVDVYPHYKQLVAPDSDTYRLMQAIIRACMPVDNITNKKDVDLVHP